jgi:hypothetical protein
MRFSGKTLLPFLCSLLLACAGAHPAVAATASHTPSQLKPLSLPHLYWHFLIHQADVDAFVAKRQATGQNSNALRNDLQSRLGFSDAEYAPIRTSSQRLASELKPISEQLRSLPHSPNSASQAKALIAQREAFINSEVYNLSLELSPENKAALEKFMANFFAPKPLTFKIPASAGQQAVQGVTK